MSRPRSWSVPHVTVLLFTVGCGATDTAAPLPPSAARLTVEAPALVIASGTSLPLTAVQLTVRPVPVARVEIAPSTPSVRIGQDIVLTATLRGSDGLPLSGRTVEWESLSPAVVSVGSSGVVTGVGSGTADVRAVAEGLAGRVTTAPMRYDPTRPIGEAGPGLFEFWQPAADRVSWTPLAVTVVQEAQYCMHPRMAVVTDVNADRRPDLYVLCHGYDAFPFPGERSMVLVSQTDGTYRQRYFSSRVAFYHGGAACDLNGDGQPELITADGAGVHLWTLDADGRGTIDMVHPVSQLNGQYYTTECLDVDGNGSLDVIVGGHEPPIPPLEWSIPTTIIFNAGTRTPTTRTIPGIPTDPIVLDFTVTGSGATRALWVLRTAMGYVGSVLQRVDLATFTSTVAKRSPEWFPRLLPYERNGVHYLGTNALGRGWEMPYVP